jgi:hypothetical protein
LTVAASRVAWAAIVVGTSVATWAAVPACALFTDLNGSEYSAVDAGRGDAACAEAGCGQPLCLSTEDCSPGQVCCLTGGFVGSPTIACQDTCNINDFAIQLCQGQTDKCDNGATCITGQLCSLGGTKIQLSSCTQIPTCALP